MTTSTEPRPSLTERLRGMSPEMLGFAVIGLSGVVVNFAIFWVCVNGLGLASLRSNVVATVIAIATNYLGYRYWLYRDRDAASRQREITLFLLFSGIGMLIETGVLALSRYGLGLDGHYEQLGAKVVGLGVATVFRFVSYRTWVFKAMPELAEPEVVAGPEPEVVAEAELLLAAEEPTASVK
ncbi:GtrA family protein [Kitasatospora sp. NPDC048365]|uniref:GtrA family protein n=1 Tax=Kitasatospora sp. NPDC048365 TaxID=3364050 RepID=UPI0037178010